MTTAPRTLRFSVEVTIVHQVGPIREPDDVGGAVEAHFDGETVQLTTNEAFPVRSTYKVAEVEVLEEIGPST
jgi:hypothetical protein